MHLRSGASFGGWAAGILAVLAVAGVRAGGPAWQERLEAFRAQQEVAQRSVKEPPEVIEQRYGTPEVTFAEPRCAAPGETAAVTLPGKINPGTLFVVESDEVKVVSEKVGAKGWEAKLAIPATAPPGPIYATVVQPITARQAGGPLLEVCGKYELSLRLQGGLALRVAPAGGAHLASFTRPPSTAVLGQVPAALAVHGSGQLSLDLPEDPAHQQARMEALMHGEEVKIMQESQQRCDSRAPIEKYMACVQGYVAKLEAAKQRRIERAAREVPACGQGNLELAGGKVTGTFKGCDDDLPDVPVEGTYRFVGK
jgi:hypothetical protein